MNTDKNFCYGNDNGNGFFATENTAQGKPW